MTMMFGHGIALRKLYYVMPLSITKPYYSDWHTLCHPIKSIHSQLKPNTVLKWILIKRQPYLQSTVGSQVITQTQEDTAGAAANRALFNWIRSDPFN